MQTPDTVKPKDVPKSSRQRLDRISHHLLGDTKSVSTETRSPFFLPVLLDSSTTDFPISAFVEAFHHQGKIAQVLQADGEQYADDSVALEEFLRTPPNQQCIADICLIPVSDPQHPCISKFGRVLMLVPSSLDGIRQAYIDLKQWSESENPPIVGTTMLGNEDHASSVWLFSGKLVSGAMSFLKWQPMSFGYLLNPANRSAGKIPAGLHDVASLIVRDWLQKPDSRDLREDRYEQRPEHKKDPAAVKSSVAKLPHHVTTVSGLDAAVVRKLIVESVPSLGNLKVVDAECPCVDKPILAIDDKQNPVIIGFGSDDAGSALLSGLAAIDELKANRQWLDRLYPGIFSRQEIDNCRLIVLTEEIRSNEQRPQPRCLAGIVDWISFRTLSVNGEVAILFEDANGEPAVADSHEEIEQGERVDNQDPPVRFTPEERQFFQAL